MVRGPSQEPGGDSFLASLRGYVLEGARPYLILGVAAVAVYVAGEVRSSQYLLGAATATGVFLLGTVLWLFAKRALQRWRTPQDEQIRALEHDAAEREALLRLEKEKNRNLERNAELQRKPVEAYQRLKGKIEQRDQQIADLKHSKKRQKAEIKELQPLAALGKIALVAFDVVRSWEAVPSRWREDMSVQERVHDFVVSDLRPQLARIYPHLKGAGVAIITRVDGEYHLAYDEGAPDVLGMVGPKPATYRLDECLKKLGIADYNLRRIPGRSALGREEWMALFAPMPTEDPAFDYLMSCGAKILALARDV